MKKRVHLITALTMLLAYSCNFSVGTEKDFATGLSFQYRGFRVEYVSLIDSASQKINSNRIPFNSRIGFLVTGLSNFTIKNGLVYPGMTVEITDGQGLPVVGASPDLFSQTSGFSPTEASVLLGSAMISAPMERGESYQLKTHVWDKNNAANILDAEVDIIVK